MRYYILWENVQPLRFDMKFLHITSSLKEATLFSSSTKAKSALRSHIFTVWFNNQPYTIVQFDEYYNKSKYRYNIISEEEFIIKEIIE